MLLEKICVFVDPSKILLDNDYELLKSNADNYEEVWKAIKKSHNIVTNLNAKDIQLYSEQILKLQTKNPVPNIIPEEIRTNSGFLIGIEFKDLKKLNPDITADNLDEAFILNCIHFGGAMDEDKEAEYIDGYLTFENKEYDSSDENSKPNVTYEVCWEIKKEQTEEEDLEESNDSEISEDSEE